MNYLLKGVDSSDKPKKIIEEESEKSSILASQEPFEIPHDQSLPSPDSPAVEEDIQAEIVLQEEDNLSDDIP